MNKYLTISASTMLLFAGLFLITGCSSSDDAPVSTTPTPTVPVSGDWDISKQSLQLRTAMVLTSM